MRGRDPRICRWREMAGLIPGSSPGTKGPAMTLFVVRHARARPAHLPLARDGRIKSGHDVVCEAVSEAFAGMTIEGTCHAGTWSAHLPLSRDGRIKSGHDVVGKAGFWLSPE